MPPAQKVVGPPAVIAGVAGFALTVMFTVAVLLRAVPLLAM